MCWYSIALTAIAVSTVVHAVEAFVPNTIPFRSKMLLYTAPTHCNQNSPIHTVHHIECREVPIEIESLGTIVILEGTAKAQDDLVNAALLQQEEEPLNQDSSISDQASTLSLNVGDPYGAVLWPAASAISEYLVRRFGDRLPELSILEVGTGTGLVSLTASRAGVGHILATDYETVPLKLLKYADTNLNQGFVHVTPIETALFDLCDSSVPLPPADLVVAADIMYKPTTGRCMARRAIEALQRGSRVLVGDSPGRAGRPAFLETLREMGVPKANFVDTTGRTCSGPRHDLICGKGSTSVSDIPQALSVAILDLDPSTAFDNQIDD